MRIIFCGKWEMKSALKKAIEQLFLISGGYGAVKTRIYLILAQSKNAGYAPTADALAYSTKVFENKYNNREKNFANAREVRNDQFIKMEKKYVCRITNGASVTCDYLSAVFKSAGRYYGKY